MISTGSDECQDVSQAEAKNIAHACVELSARHVEKRIQNNGRRINEKRQDGCKYHGWNGLLTEEPNFECVQMAGSQWESKTPRLNTEEAHT